MAVVGIGQCSWDWLLRVESYPPPDTKREVEGIEEQGGGPVATALVALRRLGISTRFHGIAGDDEAGDKIARSLGDEGVDAEGLMRRPGALSQVAFIAVERGGRRTIFWRRPSGRPLMPEELGGGFLRGARFLLLDGLMGEVSLHAARRAREAGVPVMLDAGRVREGMMELARLSDYVVSSKEFAKETGIPVDLEGKGTRDEFIRKARAIAPGVFTVTLGEGGSLTHSGGEVIHQAAFRVEAVDTTGAGDVFHGGYIHGLLTGWDLRKTLRFASALAAMKCTRPGGRAGIPSLKDAMAFLESREREG